MAYFEVGGELDATEREQEAAGRAALARFTAISDRVEQSRGWIALDDELRARALTLIAHDPWGFAARGVLRSAVLWPGDLPPRAEDITSTSAALWRLGGPTWFLRGLFGGVLMARRT